MNFKTPCVGVYKCLLLIVGFTVTVAVWPREVVSCRDFILHAVATFWAMLLVEIYPSRASVAHPGRGSGGSRRSPIRPDACLRLKFLHRQDRISLFNWLFFFLMKRVLHFATKINSRDIKTLQKSSQIEKLIVISAFSATGGRGCGGKVIWHKKVEQSFANQSLDPPIKNSWIRTWLGLKSECVDIFQQNFLWLLRHTDKLQ